MKKILFCCIILLLISGCRATYTLELKDGNFYENIDLILDNDAKLDSIDYLSDNDVFVDMDDKIKYNKTIKKKTKETDINLNYLYKNYKFNNSRVLRSCFASYNVIEDDYNYIISTSTGFVCYEEYGVPNFDSLTIKFKTDEEVVSNNADEVKGNTYYWYINDENYDSKSINIKVSKLQKAPEEEKNEDSELGLIIASIVILVIGVLSFIIFKIKNNNSNKI